jgi:hypothetical protein
LAADQQAMLQLLLERGQRYADLASVLGVEEAEVRSRARAALTELAGADPDRNVGLTDYLLGQADPIGRADAVRHLKEDPEDLELATQLSQKLLLVAPDAKLPRLPGEERRPRTPRRGRTLTSRLPLPGRDRGATPVSEASSRSDGVSLTRRQGQLIVGLVCAALLLAVVVVALTVGFGGGSSSGSTAASTTTTGNARLASVALKPPGGGSASGSVVFGVANGSQLYADIRLRGLKAPPKGQAYVIWFLLTQTQGYPVPTVLNVSQGGTYQNRVTIPSAEIPIANQARSLDVSIAPVNAVEAAIKTAFKQRRLVQKPGSTVLAGKIPASRTGSGGGSGG